MQFQRVSAQQRQQARDERRTVRARTIAAIHVTWKKIRKDLHDPEELRDQRLAFMAGVLKKKSLGSSRDLTNGQLGRVLDAMRDLESQPELPGSQAIHQGLPAPETDTAWADVHHLATAAQASTIEKLIAHLGWSPETTENFLFKRFHRTSHRMLSPQDANSATVILLTIAAARSIKDRTKAEHVSRTLIRAEIPALKRRLGIDQAKVDDDGGN